MISGRELSRFFNKELRKRRWFGQKSEKIKVEIEDRIPAYRTENLAIEFFMLKVKPGRRRYFLPLAFTKSAFQVIEAPAIFTLESEKERIHVFEAEYLDLFPSIIYRMFEEGERFTGKRMEIVFTLRRGIRGERVRKGEVIGGDSTNINLKILSTERTMVLKTYRVFDVDNPEVEMMLQLSGSKNVPEVLGYAEVLIEGISANGFLLMEFMDSAGDGIKAFMKDVNFLISSGMEQEVVIRHSEKLAGILGRITAEMHAQLVGNDEKFRAEKITGEDIERWKVRVLSNLDYCLERILGLPESENREALLKIAEGVERGRVLELLEAASNFEGILKIRTHQDYHLGQVLYGKEDTFYILDFEGEPGRKGEERREKLPPLRDVATMLRSFSYLKHLAFRNYLEERLSITGEREKLCWAPVILAGVDTGLTIPLRVPEMLNLYEEKVAEAFVSAYTQRLSELNPSLLPEKGTREKMLKFWKMEKAVYELKYELEYRLDYAGIPLEGILRELRY
ncbi:MAG: hypothetical protein QXJ27_02390 [Thermoplasmata archaeon]